MRIKVRFGRSTGFAAKIGLSPISGRIVTRKQGQRMLSRLAGLRSVQKQRAAGWPNLKRATAMHQLRCRFRRCAAELGFSAADREDAWYALALMGPERALRLDMAGWMEKREFEQRWPPDWVYQQQAQARQHLREIAERMRQERLATDWSRETYPIGLHGLSPRGTR